MTGGPLFSKKAVGWLVGVGSVSFVLVIVASVLFVNPRFFGSPGADSFSPSAIGHKAFVEALKGSGHTVIQSQNQSAEKAGPGNLLILLEPGVDPDQQAELENMLRVQNVLLVLPKRTGFSAGFNPRWVDVVFQVGEDRLKTLLDAVDGFDFSEEVGATITQEGQNQIWANQDFQGVPEIEAPQTIKWSRLTPIVSNEEGVLLGRVKDAPNNIYVLTDPDILQTHGIAKEANARFTAELILLAGQATDTIIIDETAHGFFQPPGLLENAFSPPLVYPVVFLLLALIILLLATTVGFATPARENLGLSKSKLPLINNISSLLNFGGHHRQITEAYYQEALKEVATQLSAPAGIHGEDLVKWVDDIGKRRNAKTSFKALQSEATETLIANAEDKRMQTSLAQKIYHWRKEVLDGVGKNKETE